MVCAGIVASDLTNDKSLTCFKQCASILRDSGINVLCEESASQYLNDAVAFERSESRPEVLFSIGGDGTLLRSVQFAVKYKAPVLGINRGFLGFLTETSPSKMEQAIRSVIDGRYTIENRPLMTVGIDNSQLIWYALNDAVITRGGYSRLISIYAYCSGKLIESFKADGIVISTPTGSTGYSFSAGGPIVYPSVECLLVTPVCAHTLQHYTCVLPFDSRIGIELRGDDAQSAVLQTDGQTKCRLQNNSVIRIAMSDVQVKMIRLEPHDYFETIRQRLN